MYCCPALQVKNKNLYICPLPYQDTDELMLNAHIGHEMLTYEIIHAQFTTDSAVHHLRMNTKSLNTDRNEKENTVSKKFVNLFQPSHHTPHS
jgi:hypothetical protein